MFVSPSSWVPSGLRSTLTNIQPMLIASSPNGVAPNEHSHEAWRTFFPKITYVTLTRAERLEVKSWSLSALSPYEPSLTAPTLKLGQPCGETYGTPHAGQSTQVFLKGLLKSWSRTRAGRVCIKPASVLPSALMQTLRTKCPVTEQAERFKLYLHSFVIALYLLQC